MAAQVQITRRPSTFNTTPGAAANTSLYDGQLFYNENDDSFWIGKGTGGTGGTSTSVVGLGGPGVMVTLSGSSQTISGPKVWTGANDFTASAITVESQAVASAGSTSKVAVNIGFVMAQPLNTFATPVANLSMGGYLINNLGTPVATGDAATKAYVDSKVQGLTPKATAYAATSAALPSNTYNGGALTLTATSNGALSIDGLSPSAGSVVLIKNEATAANNGLYDVTSAGSGSSAWVLTRDASMSTGPECVGAFVPVGAGGTANGNTLWLCNPSGTVTLGTTALPWTQLNAATNYLAGAGVSIASNTVSVSLASGGGLTTTGGLGINASWLGQNTITTLGTITTGTWNAGASSIAASSLPVATTAAIGGVQVGTGIGVAAGLISVAYGSTAGTAVQGNDTRITGALQTANDLSELNNSTAANAALANLGLQASGSFAGKIDGGYV